MERSLEDQGCRYRVSARPCGPAHAVHQPAIPEAGRRRNQEKGLVAILEINKRGRNMMRYLITLIVLISVGFSGISAIPVNETVMNFRISFDSINDTNMVAKFWSDEDKIFNEPLPENATTPTNEIIKAAGIVSGNASDSSDRWGGCIIILVLKNPENTSVLEKHHREWNRTVHKVFDRTIDGHKALLLKTADYPSDPLMEFEAMYWLDEVNGEATKLVFVVSGWPEKSRTAVRYNSRRRDGLKRRKG